MAVFNNVLTGASGQTTGGAYEIERSLRFNSSDSAYLSRTPASAGSDTTLTFSAWVKRSGSASPQIIFSTRTNDSNRAHIGFTSDSIMVVGRVSNSKVLQLITDAVYRDFSAWMHILVVVDTSNGTSSDRCRLYVNGTRVTSFSTETYSSGTTSFGAASQKIGVLDYSSNLYYLDGYLADIHFIDGQALDPSSFGEFDDNGVWQPKAYTGTYGTNGFHLPFSDNSTAAALGTDTSGNGNDWTVSPNISVAAGSGNDSLVDTPTNYGTDTGAGGEVRGNYCTLNPLLKAPSYALPTLSNGNLDVSSSANNMCFSTFQVNSGKWFYECTVSALFSSTDQAVRFADPDNFNNQKVRWVASGSTSGLSGNPTFSSYTAGDVLGTAVDMDTRKAAFYKNGVQQGTGFYDLSNYSTGDYLIPGWFASGSGASGSFNFGQRPFAYTAPSGYKALCTTNLDDPVVAKPSTVMDVALWTGDGNDNRVITTNFSPEFLWLKRRDTSSAQRLTDVVRGDGKILYSDSTDAETTETTTIKSLGSTGFTLGTSVGVNASGGSYVGWHWDAGSSTVTNPNGSIPSQVRANPTAGFSIVTYTGTGANATIGHGLSVTPSFIITKKRSNTSNWATNAPGRANPWDGALLLNSTQAFTVSSAVWQDTAPTSSVFYVGTADAINASSETYVAYCFAPVDGYSSFGSYTGNGSADGPFVFTGMRPRWIMFKCSSTDNGYTFWEIIDTARPNNLAADLSDAEGSFNLGTGLGVDILSNGFKIRGAGSGKNLSSQTYIYAAFAESPQKFSRAR